MIIGAMMADVSLRMTEPSSDHFSLERAVVTDYQDLRLGTSWSNNDWRCPLIVLPGIPTEDAGIPSPFKPSGPYYVIVVSQ